MARPVDDVPRTPRRDRAGHARPRAVQAAVHSGGRAAVASRVAASPLDRRGPRRDARRSAACSCSPGPVGRTTTTSRPTSCRRTSAATGTTPNYNVQTTQQMEYLQQPPVRVRGAIGRTITDHGVKTAHDVMVQMTSGACPGGSRSLVAFGLLAAVLVDAGPLAGGRRMWLCVLSLAAVTVVVSLFLAYVGWNCGAGAADRRLPGPLPRGRGRDGRARHPGARGHLPSDPRLRIERVGLWLAGWSALMLVAVEVRARAALIRLTNRSDP